MAIARLSKDFEPLDVSLSEQPAGVVKFRSK
jgi:hypothetical protein